MRRVILPLLRPAIVAALVFSFVRAMTAISAVIFLVSANYDMATSYIIGRVENGDYGLAIAYSSVLILVMLIAIVAGPARGRRAPAAPARRGPDRGRAAGRRAARVTSLRGKRGLGHLRAGDQGVRPGGRGPRRLVHDRARRSW